eukprot:scaffold237070_cov21-Prasinocladus_malaysianus.AAC.2
MSALRVWAQAVRELSSSSQLTGPNRVEIQHSLTDYAKKIVATRTIVATFIVCRRAKFIVERQHATDSRTASIRCRCHLAYSGLAAKYAYDCPYRIIRVIRDSSASVLVRDQNGY